MAPPETGVLIRYLTETFRFQAWIALGKIMHPMTGKIERDLEGARQTIDLLAELETRTEGNRSEDESRLLRGALTELRLNYLEESKKPPTEEPRVEKPPTEEPASGESSAENPDRASMESQT